MLTEAVVQKEHRGVDDPDQAWILGELIRYLEHPRSGALEFEDMGSAWVSVRDAIAAGTFRNSDKGAAEVVNRFDALLRFTGLRLGRQLGTDVALVTSRREAADPTIRSGALLQQLTERGSLTGSLRISDTVAPLVVTADLRANQVICHVDVQGEYWQGLVHRVGHGRRRHLLRDGGPEPQGLERGAATTPQRGA